MSEKEAMQRRGVEGEPPVSIVMPVRNALPYLDEAVRSILAQTHRNFEFVILDDGSTDGSGEALAGWAGRDARIRLFQLEESLGPVGSSNFVMEKARHDLVARMDADDVCCATRIERQIAVIRANADAVLVGCLWEGIDAEGRKVRPCNRWRLAHPGVFAPFPHGSILVRRDAVMRAGGYSPESEYWEDADLYVRLAQQGRLLVIADPLYLHRASALSTRLKSDEQRVEHAVDQMYRTLGGFAHGRGDAGGRILPKVFVSIGSTRLWSGASPGVLRRLWRRGDLRLDAHSFSVLAWALWGALLPGSLRWVLRSLARIRDRKVRSRFRGGCAHEWRPTSTARAMSRANGGYRPQQHASAGG